MCIRDSVSLDQMLFKERPDPDDGQGLGLFARYGCADGAVNDIRCFWSVGAQYQGLIPTRDHDVLGFGVAQGVLSPHAGFTSATETAYEVYYNAEVAPWLTVSPSVQVIDDPGGDRGARDSVVFGVRVQMAF